MLFAGDCCVDESQVGRAVADLYRQRLIALYGADRGRAIEYAEAFQLGQYGRQPSPDELKALFPMP